MQIVNRASLVLAKGVLAMAPPGYGGKSKNLARTRMTGHLSSAEIYANVCRSDVRT